MRALITGSGGFVGGYLRRELEENGYEVEGLDLRPGAGSVQADLLDEAQVRAALRRSMPDVLFHLAGQADVAKSWKMPRRTVELNVVAAVNLLEAARRIHPSMRMVLVGSSDEYGPLGEDGALVRETMETRPQTPYAVSKKAQEELAEVYCRAYGMQICMTRSFNHGGAGQREGFLLADLACGIVRVEKGQAQALHVGNLDARRDFTHVRDVVRAYRLLAERGERGEIYNVGSGRAYCVRDILAQMLALAKCPIPVEQDAEKLRPSDTPVLCCDHSKLTARTGWEPAIPLEEMLRETLEDWRARL